MNIISLATISLISLYSIPTSIPKSETVHQTIIAQAGEECRAVSAQGGLRVRQNPSINAPVIDILVNGRIVTIESLGQGGWVPISYPVNGYVSAYYLTNCGSVPPPTTPNDPANPCRQVSAQGGLYVRREPDIDSPRVELLPNGTKVQIESLGANGWVPITFPQNGFVSARYLTSCSYQQVENNGRNGRENQQETNNKSEETQENSNQYSVQVFFPVTPSQSDNFTAVRPVTRTTTSQAVAQFAIEQLIAGPTNAEKQKGLIDPIELTGESNCGEDFTISITEETAKLQFCRTVPTAGVGEDARLQTAIKETLTQFSTIEKVIILNRNGDCFKDLSGKNLCLQ